MKHNSEQEDGQASSQVETISNWVIGPIGSQKAPCRDQPSNIAKHNVQPNAGSTGCVCHQIGGQLRVGESTIGECPRADEECSSITDVR